MTSEQITHHSFVATMGFQTSLDTERARQVAESVTSGHLVLGIPIPIGRQQLIFRSASGHTNFVVGPDKATLHTTYFGPFIEPASSDARLSYAYEKSVAAFDIIDAVGGIVDLFNVSLVARLVPASNKVDAFRRAVASALLSSGFMQSNEEAVAGFTVQMGLDATPISFSSLAIVWYQDRQFVLPSGSVTPGDQFAFKEWDARPVGEGVQLTYSHNNKRGLLAGKRSWEREDFLAMVRAALGGSTEKFARVVGLIADHWKGE